MRGVHEGVEWELLKQRGLPRRYGIAARVKILKPTTPSYGIERGDDAILQWITCIILQTVCTMDAIFRFVALAFFGMETSETTFS